MYNVQYQKLCLLHYRRLIDIMIIYDIKCGFVCIYIFLLSVCMQFNGTKKSQQFVQQRIRRKKFIVRININAY